VRRLGAILVSVVGGTLTLISLPLFVLNVFGGVVSGIWLMVLGRWGEFGLGVLILISGSLLIGFTLTPAMFAQFTGRTLVQGKRIIVGAGFLLMSALWIYFVMYVWCGLTFTVIVAIPRGHMIPLALWGYANAAGPWTYLASKDPGGSGSTIAVLAAQLGCVAMMVGLLFLHAEHTVAGLAPYLFPFIAAAVITQTILLVVVAVAYGGEANDEARASRVAETFK
jgi:hypothetical protein